VKVLLLDVDAEFRDDLGRSLLRECFAVDEVDTLRQANELMCCSE
jgi:DNA-binding response OmpR family regulator